MRKSLLIALVFVLIPALSFAVMPQPPGGSPGEAEAFFAAPPGGAAACAAHVSCHGKRGASGGMGMMGAGGMNMTGPGAPGMTGPCGGAGPCGSTMMGPGGSGMMGGGMNMVGPGGAGMPGSCGSGMTGPCGSGMPVRCGPDECASCLKRLGVEGAVAEQVRAVCRARQKEMVSLAAKLKVAEMDLEDLSAADKLDLKAMEARVREVEKVRGDMRMAHLAGWQKIKTLLPAEARARLSGCCPSPVGRMCPPGMGCGGRNSPMPMCGPGCR